MADLMQPTILAPPPAAGCALTFSLRPGADARAALNKLSGEAVPNTAVGVGLPLVKALGAALPGLTAFPALEGTRRVFPSTQGALWAFVDGDDPGQVHDSSVALCARLGHDFVIADETATWRYRGGRDLTGYEDGTENPTGDKARAAAMVSGHGPGLDGSSFVAVQRYVHDLQAFAAQTPAQRDDTVGRSLATNEELPDAPPSAHVKRAAQESFDPPAFMVRRSMPWGGVKEHGLVFVAYVESLGRFERVLHRMAGLDDGISDALMGFSRAVTGGYYWCPPITGAGQFDLRGLLGPGAR